MPYYREYYPPSRPRPVEGGLAAKTARGAIGSSWWSKRFIEVLESFAIGTRLTRGRAYARKGQVIDLLLAPGVVTAKVQGSRVRPYSVQIRLAPFDEATWAAVDAALAAQAIHTAALLAGELPPELEGVFADAGARLFPGAVKQLEMSCSCPDWGMPCKHLAATFYLLAERFDDDPFEILHWRGRPREELLGRVRRLRSSGSDRAGEALDASAGDDASPEVAGAAQALADLPDHPVSPALYWASPVPLPPAPIPIDAPSDLLLRQLPDPPADLGGERLATYLRHVYAALPDPEDTATNAPQAGPSSRRRGGKRPAR